MKRKGKTPPGCVGAPYLFMGRHTQQGGKRVEREHPPTCPEGTSLVGCVSHVITVERHKVAWGKINPKLRNLAIADYGERKSNLFGPGFLEKASRLETEKTLAKVSGISQCPFAKKPRYDSNKSNHRSFVSKGASVQCRNARGRHKQPHTFRVGVTTKETRARNFTKTRPRSHSPRTSQTSSTHRTPGLSVRQYPWCFPIHYSPSGLTLRGWSASVLFGELETDNKRSMIWEVASGYHLELAIEPCQESGPRPIAFSGKAEQMVSEEVRKLVKKRAIVPVRPWQDSQIFVVQKKDGTQRPVVNLKPSNCLVVKQKFKMEGI